MTAEQLLWAELFIAALSGWIGGYALVFDVAPAAGRLARRCWRRWTA